MRLKRIVSLLAILAAGLRWPGPSQAQTVELSGDVQSPGVSLAYVGMPYQANSPSTLSYEFAYLKQSVGLWADGKGDVLLEQHLTNTSSSSADVFDRITWRFSWPSGVYTDVRAKDARGPLDTEQVAGEDGLYVTVIFRRAVPQNTTYELKLFITISGMAQGSGDNWAANWYTSGGATVKVFEEVLALPANANVTSISPTATERHGNIVTWLLENQSNWTLSIYVPYVLSNSVSVPMYLQSTLPWGDDLYANNTSPVDDMAKWGCLTTSGAMVVNYLAATQDRNHRTDPGVLNTWLKDNDGYTALNGVKHAWVGKYARDLSRDISMYWNRSIPYNASTVDYYIRSGYPVILGVKPIVVGNATIPGHYVVATAKTTEDETPTYSINDPAYGATSLKSQWSNVALTMILFSASEANQQLLYFAAQSPVEFVVTDPIGRRSGYDPNTGTTWSEIPDAYYLRDGLGDLDGTSEPIYMKVLNLPDPLDGEYAVTVFGTGTGSYTLEATSMDWQGTSVNRVFTGDTTEGEVHTHIVTYSDVISLLYLPLISR